MIDPDNTPLQGFFKTQRSSEEIKEFNKDLLRALINLRKLEDFYFAEYVNSNKKFTNEGE